jgi:hypothetical protein
MADHTEGPAGKRRAAQFLKVATLIIRRLAAPNDDAPRRSDR